MNHPTSMRRPCFSTAATSPASCAPNPRYPNSSRHCSGARNNHLPFTIHFSGTPDMSQPKLLEPYKLGPITLPNRFVMAPLTRNRAGAGLVPNPLAVEYYGQRASARLLISEATQASQQGQGYQETPGIYSK